MMKMNLNSKSRIKILHKIFIPAAVLLFLNLTSVSCSKHASSEVENPVTFTFYSADADNPVTFDDMIAKEITKRTGVTLDFLDIKQEPSQYISLMIANKTYPDFIFAKGDITPLIDAGALIPLDDLIEKYGDNIKKLYGDQIVRLRYNLDNPAIYTVGTYEVKTKTYETSGTMQIQNEVLKEFGYPRIKTLDDYENLLKAYITKYPEINGVKTSGFSLCIDDWYWYVSLSNPANYLIGYPDDGEWIVNQNSLEAVYKFLYPGVNIYYKWLNKIYNEGLLDPESFTMNKDMWESKLETGSVLGTSFPFWGLQQIQLDLMSNDMMNRTYAYLPITISPDIKDPSLKDYGFSGGWGIAISKDCQDPERAFKFLDWMCSEEAQILTNWGIEDIHYYYDSLGRRVVSDHPNSTDDGVGKWRYPFPEGGAGYIDSTGNPLSKNLKENIINGYTSVEKETLNAYGVEMWIDLFPTPEELGISKHGQIWQYPLNSELNNLISQADEYVKSQIVSMIMGSPDDFDDSWKKMQAELVKMGMEDAGKQVTGLILQRMELWSY